MDMVDFRTEQEKFRDERDKKICSKYSVLIRQPKATPNRVYNMLGEEFNLTSVGIIRILKKYKVLFTPEIAN